MAQDEPRADKRLKSESSRKQVLGDNPKEVRDRARRLLEPGYYVSASGRSATRFYFSWETATHYQGSIVSVSVLGAAYAVDLRIRWRVLQERVRTGSWVQRERRLRLQRRRERSERNWNLALAERREAWKDRLSVVQVTQLFVLTCSIPCGFLSWCEGRACTVLQGLSTNGQNSLLLTRKGIRKARLSAIRCGGKTTLRLRSTCPESWPFSMIRAAVVRH